LTILRCKADTLAHSNLEQLFDMLELYGAIFLCNNCAPWWWKHAWVSGFRRVRKISKRDY